MLDLWAEDTAEEAEWKALKKKEWQEWQGTDKTLAGRRQQFLRRSNPLFLANILSAQETLLIFETIFKADLLLSHRHDAFSTRDISVPIHSEIGILIHEKVITSLEMFYGFHEGDLEILDLFLVAYSCEEGGQRSLDIHTDGSLISFNILLNSADEFEGGGTLFSTLTQTLVELKRGQMLAHESRLLHGGRAITKGCRYLLVGFVETKRTGPLSKKHLLQKGRMRGMA